MPATTPSSTKFEAIIPEPVQPVIRLEIPLDSAEEIYEQLGDTKGNVLYHGLYRPLGEAISDAGGTTNPV